MGLKYACSISLASIGIKRFFGFHFGEISPPYLTPPMAPAIFYLRGIAPPEIKIESMFRGIDSFMMLQLLGIALVVVFPQLALWLPGKLIGWK